MKKKVFKGLLCTAMALGWKVVGFTLFERVNTIPGDCISYIYKKDSLAPFTHTSLPLHTRSSVLCEAEEESLFPLSNQRKCICKKNEL